MAGLTNKGYIKRTPLEIQDDIISEIKEKSPEFIKHPADVQANIIDTSVAVVSQLENLIETLFNSYSMSGSDELLFRMQAEELGLRQKSEFKSQVVLEFTGLPGDIIPRTTICSDITGEYKFETTETIMLGALGRGSVLALGEAEVTIPAKKINTLVTTLSSGVGVSNPQASLPRIEAESFAEFKARSQARLRSPRLGGKLYAETLIKGIEGVSPRLVAFNCVDYTEKDFESSSADKEVFFRLVGIEAVIGGGDEYAIALALYQSFFETQKLLSRPSDNDETRTIVKDVNLYNNDFQIVFTRPKLLQLNLRCLITLTGMLSSAESVRQATQDDISNYVNSLKVGTNIGMYKLIDLLRNGLESIGITASAYKFVKFQYCIGEYEDTPSDAPESTIPWQNFNEDAKITEIAGDCYCELVRYEVKMNAGE